MVEELPVEVGEVVHREMIDHESRIITSEFLGTIISVFTNNHKCKRRYILTQSLKTFGLWILTRDTIYSSRIFGIMTISVEINLVFVVGLVVFFYPFSSLSEIIWKRLDIKGVERLDDRRKGW